MPNNKEIEQINKVLPVTNEMFSPTFCLAKWHHTTIYLATGETHSCYHPAPHKIPLEELKDNPSALHNTKEKKAQRKQMLCGEKPGGCDYCWKIEAMGNGYISDRHIKTASIFTPARVQEIKNAPDDFNIDPEYIEISFSNECNFKCGYCHPKASSRYWKEIEDYGPYSMSSTHRQDIDWFTVAKNEEENPYVDAWWKWWPQVSRTLNILRITGGEPLMHKSLWDLFEKLEADPKPHIKIEVISNIAKFNPGASALFETISENQTENGFKVPSGVIMQVLRSDGDANLSASYGNILRPCKLVSNELQELVKNPSSIYFANDNYPVWIRGEDNTVNVFPEIDSNINEYYQVHYMNYPEYDNMNKVLSSETDIDNVGIKNFPKAYHPHLLLYGAIQSLKQYYLYLLNEEEDMELAQIYLKNTPF